MSRSPLDADDGRSHNANMTAQQGFEVGKSYSARSLCDYECIWTWTVTRRTRCFITVTEELDARPVRVKVHVGGDGIEWALPLGDYSMAPSISADRPAVVTVEWPAPDPSTRLDDIDRELYFMRIPS